MEATELENILTDLRSLTAENENKLPDWMDEKQKKIKNNNLISELSRNRIIKNIGTFRDSKWVLIN